MRAWCGVKTGAPGWGSGAGGSVAAGSRRGQGAGWRRAGPQRCLPAEPRLCLARLPVSLPSPRQLASSPPRRPLGLAWLPRCPSRCCLWTTCGSRGGMRPRGRWWRRGPGAPQGVAVAPMRWLVFAVWLAGEWVEGGRRLAWQLRLPATGAGGQLHCSLACTAPPPSLLPAPPPEKLYLYPAVPLVPASCYDLLPNAHPPAPPALCRAAATRACPAAWRRCGGGWTPSRRVSTRAAAR